MFVIERQQPHGSSYGALITCLAVLIVSPLTYAQVPENCNDGLDNDGDTLVDCDDPDCLVSTYIDSGQALGNSVSQGVALGDLDGDGDLDAWVANGPASSGQTNRVWLNDGVGVYSDSGQALGSSQSYDVALGDVDGDGDLDAWVVNISSANRVWINDGLGNFSDSGQGLGNSSSTDVSLGDVDGDGDLDAWVVNISSANRVWINDGLGNYSDSGQGMGSADSIGVSLGDVDGDGDLDAWVANIGVTTGGQPNRVWLNNGIGTYSDSGQALGSSQSFDVALGDVDDDGDLDAWVANLANPPSVTGEADRVWLNNGTGVYIDSGQMLGNFFSRDVSLGDVDGDGDLDAWVAIADSGGQPNRVWLNDGNGNYSGSGQALGNSQSFDASLGDVDGDGDLDAWVAASGPNRVWLNDAPCFAVLFLRSDVNVDGSTDIGDALTLLVFLFGGGVITCDDAGDSNDDGALNVADVISILGYLFIGSAPPPAPFPDCGGDPTGDLLGCDSYSAC